MTSGFQEGVPGSTEEENVSLQETAQKAPVHLWRGVSDNPDLYETIIAAEGQT